MLVKRFISKHIFFHICLIRFYLFLAFHSLPVKFMCTFIPIPQSDIFLNNFFMTYLAFDVLYSRKKKSFLFTYTYRKFIRIHPLGHRSMAFNVNQLLLRHAKRSHISQSMYIYCRQACFTQFEVLCIRCSLYQMLPKT